MKTIEFVICLLASALCAGSITHRKGIDPNDAQSARALMVDGNRSAVDYPRSEWSGAAAAVKDLAGSITHRTGIGPHDVQSARVLMVEGKHSAVDDPQSEWSGPAATLENLDVKWPSTSQVPAGLQWFFVITWVGMVSSLPLLVSYLDEHEATLTQKCVGGCLLLVLFGGLYLFTQVILFQSVHFDRKRPLTFIECIYFMSQIITTVGYGDIVPAYVRGQVFVGLYVIGALFVIAMLVSQVMEHFTRIVVEKGSMLTQYQQQVFLQSQSCLEPGTPDTAGVTSRSSAADSQRSTSRTGTSRSSSVPGNRRTFTKLSPQLPKEGLVHALLHPEPPSKIPILRSLAGYVFIAVVFVLFFSFYPGEKKTVFQSIYMSLITLSTVGFGAVTPLTEGGMIFNAYAMIFGSAALVNVMSQFCEYVALMHQFEQRATVVQKKAMTDLKRCCKDPEHVTALEFLRFLATFDDKMTHEEFEDAMNAFEEMNPVNGTVKLETVVDALGEPSNAKRLDETV